MVGIVNKDAVLEGEETTRDIAIIIYRLIKGATLASKTDIGKQVSTYEFWSSFFEGNLIENFEKIYLCYLVKLEYFMDHTYAYSSVYYFGEIINHLLEHT